MAYSATMAELNPLQGELQLQVMAAMWNLGEGNVEQVRCALSERARGAYTTIQTVLNRLSDRGLLERAKRGNTIVYSPRITEGEYLSRSIERTLSTASDEARQVALAQLIGTLESGELSSLKRLARQIEDGRRR